MTVRELIEALSKFNPDAVVEIEYQFNDGHGKEVEEMPITTVKDSGFIYCPTIYISSLDNEP
jgi:hypothetical protein